MEEESKATLKALEYDDVTQLRFPRPFRSMARVRGHEHGLPVLLEHQDQRGGVGGAGGGAAPPTPAGARGGARPQPAAHHQLAHHQPKHQLQLWQHCQKEALILRYNHGLRLLESAEEEGGEGRRGVRAVAAGAEAGGDSDAKDQKVRATVRPPTGGRSRGEVLSWVTILF